MHVALKPRSGRAPGSRAPFLVLMPRVPVVCPLGQPRDEDAGAAGALAASFLQDDPEQLGFGAVELMLGVDSTVSALVVKDMLVKSVFAFFLGWPIYLGVRRLLRPALVEEPRARRGRQPTALGA